MHPHIQTWGSILRLYGSKVEDSLLNDETENSDCKKNNENETSSKKADNNHYSMSLETNQAHLKAKPNRELLEKLKEEMRKLKKQQQQSTENVSVKFDLNNSQELVNKNTLLSIPPLLLGDKEFKFCTTNYNLMVSKKDDGEGVKIKKPVEDRSEDIISFSDSVKKESAELEGKTKVKDSEIKRKRNMSKSDGEIDSEDSKNDCNNTASDGGTSSDSDTSTDSSSSADDSCKFVKIKHDKRARYNLNRNEKADSDDDSD